VREIKEKVKVRQIIIPLFHFDAHILLAEAMTREKNQPKNPPIKAILTDHYNSQKNNKKLQKKFNWAVLSKGWEYPLSPLVMREIFRAGRDFSVTTIDPDICFTR
jgi:hypothetical protein